MARTATPATTRPAMAPTPSAVKLLGAELGAELEAELGGELIGANVRQFRESLGLLQLVLQALMLGRGHRSFTVHAENSRR